MKAKLAVSLALGTLLVGCALDVKPHGAALGPQERGGQLAATYCGGCHAVGAQGDSPAPEAPPFRRLSAEGYRVATLEDALRQGISTGHPPMPILKLPDEDVKALVVYLQAAQTK